MSNFIPAFFLTVLCLLALGGLLLVSLALGIGLEILTEEYLGLGGDGWIATGGAIVIFFGLIVGIAAGIGAVSNG